MYRRIVTATLLLLFAPAVLFAGGSGETSQSGPSSGSVALSEEEMWKQFEGESISIIGLNVSTFEALGTVIEEFTELTGIQVNTDIYSETQGRQKQSVEIFTGSGSYDVMYFVATDWVGWIESDWIEPLEPYIDDPSLTLPGEVDLDGFVKGPLSVMYWDDALYGLPAFSATTVFYYRSDILEENGLEPPDTIQEMVDVAAQIHSDSVAGVAMRGAAGPNLWPWLSIMRGMGGSIYQDYPNDMRPALDSPEVAEAMDLYGELLRNYSIEGYATASFNEVVLALQQGKAAMSNDGAPLAPRVLDPDESRVVGKMGFAPVPAGPAGRFAPYTAHGWLIPQSAANKGPAWLFLKWVTSEETQFKMAMNARHLAVSRSSIFENPDFRERYEYGPGFLNAYLSNVNSDHVYHPTNRAYAQVRQALGQELASVIVGDKTGEEGARAAHERVDQIMRDAGFY